MPRETPAYENGEGEGKMKMGAQGYHPVLPIFSQKLPRYLEVHLEFFALFKDLVNKNNNVNQS
jgi:hypothetical protein